MQTRPEPSSCTFKTKEWDTPALVKLMFMAMRSNPFSAGRKILWWQSPKRTTPVKSKVDSSSTGQSHSQSVPMSPALTMFQLALQTNFCRFADCLPFPSFSPATFQAYVVRQHVLETQPPSGQLAAGESSRPILSCGDGSLVTHDFHSKGLHSKPKDKVNSDFSDLGLSIDVSIMYQTSRF